MSPPPMMAPPAAMPKLSTTVLIAMAAICVIILVAIFGYILFLATGLRTDERLWWTGFASMIFALAFFILYGATHDRKVARPLAAGFFLISAGSFYGSIFTGGSGDLAKLLYLILLSILVIIVLGAIFVMARDAEQDAIRRSKRKYIP
ncbi:MAG TPA: hypothetical protein VJP06_01505 [Thermoplasmata archaeon]|nr:hypothetical protein [Thermoplasmata archaeon]